jgi:DNA-binding transcriptional regulator YiaG
MGRPKAQGRTALQRIKALRWRLELSTEQFGRILSSPPGPSNNGSKADASLEA